VTGTRWNKSRKRLAAALVIALTGVAWGWMLWQLNFGIGLRQASYDLPFLFSQHDAPEDIAIVYLDDPSFQQLDQPLSQPWNRSIHADLVNRLREKGASVIAFDILFHDSRPEEDQRFSVAIEQHGKVILAGENHVDQTPNGPQQSLLLATPDLRKVAAGWGLTDALIDPDGLIRRIRFGIPTSYGIKPTLSAKTQLLLQGEDPQQELSTDPVFLNYYGPAGTFPGYSYAAVIKDEKIPENAFRNKIVFVGALQKAGLSSAGKDTFPTPYTVSTKQLTPGVEINATAAANLLHDQVLVRSSDRSGWLSIILGAFVLAAAACLLSPLRGVPLCLALAVGISVFGGWLQHAHGILTFWTIPAFGQAPLIVGLALVGHYLIEYSARWKLRRAFKSYMSDEQARQIDEDEVSLELGGREVEATILFSDLAGFTSMSEGLPPQSVSKALISYFERATEGILDNEGTIIKYVGDAVMATWGAPLKVNREADRAIDAALQMQFASSKPISLETATGTIEQVLETRIGINTGPGLAGNLGSRRRFDYSVIGDTTNTAARLEGLNKMLGTSILVSEAVLAKCEDPGHFLTRTMGSFILKGKKQGIIVHEVMGYRDRKSGTVRQRNPEYLARYQAGLDAFRSGELELAEAEFSKALLLHDRKPEDPAARLFLNHISAARGASNGTAEWHGEIALDSK